MPVKPSSQLQKDVARRLRAMQAELGLADEAMARHVGASGRTSWNNWTNGRNMPDEAAMVRLCDRERVTMDWIYRGVVEGMPVGRAIRLQARCHGLSPDDADPSVLGLASLPASPPASPPASAAARAGGRAGASAGAPATAAPSRARRKDASLT